LDQLVGLDPFRGWAMVATYGQLEMRFASQRASRSRRPTSKGIGQRLVIFD
jgi:hypothetical protein